MSNETATIIGGHLNGQTTSILAPTLRQPFQGPDNTLMALRALYGLPLPPYPEERYMLERAGDQWVYRLCGYSDWPESWPREVKQDDR